MSYWKLIPKSVGSGAAGTDFATTLNGIISGSITATSGLSTTYWETGQCYTIGTAPTSGMYTAGTVSSVSSGNSTTWYNDISNLYKYHYAKNQVSGYDPYVRIRQRMDNTYKWRWRMWSSANTNGLPVNSINYKWAYDNTYSQMGNYPYPSSYCSEMHMIINDTTLMIWAKYGTNDTATDVGVFHVNDLEFMSDVDSYYHSASDLYCPTICHWAFTDNKLLVTNADLSAANTVFYGAAMNSYFQTNGLFKAQASNGDAESGNTAYGESQLGDNKQGLFPETRIKIMNMQNASGAVYPLLPIHHRGHHNRDDTTEDGNVRAMGARWMNAYRTTDNLNTGDRIKVGSNYYRVFRVTGTATNALADAEDRACFAFPENNVAY